MIERESENSIRGKVIKDMLDHFTHDLSIGKKVQTGEARKIIPEPPYKAPSGYNMTYIDRPNYRMAFMSRGVNPNIKGAVLQLHGGGYVGQIRNKYYTFAKYYVDMTDGYCVLTPDYRVAPENVYPAALLDAYDSYMWLLEHGFLAQNIILAGDSAGGGLCMSLYMYLRDHKIELPKAIIAMSPWTDLSASGRSYEENYTKDVLFGNTKESMIYNNPYPGNEDIHNPYISPLFGSFKEFPPMLIQVGSQEMLLSDSTSVAEKARFMGVDAHLTVYEGMFHVFQMCYHMIPESKMAWDEVHKFILKINK